MSENEANNQHVSERMVLLYLKALIWSVFVAYGERTVLAIVSCLKEGAVREDDPELSETHLGDGLRFLIHHLPGPQDRETLAKALQKVKNSRPSLVYRNMVIEVGHYVTSREDIADIPVDRYGVIYRVEENQVCVLFRLTDGTLADRKVHPSQITPLYTLTVGED
ncbi:MAG: hypothetical protein ABIH23_05330 [bacterium]